MSMEKEYTLHDTHCRSITALGSSIARRELYLGFEDGQVKSFELDSGAYVQTYWEHKGWISSFLYWPLTKLLFCASNDCIISAIGAGGNLMDRVFIGTPIYSICLNQRKKEVILGVTNGIQFHTLYETKEGFSHYINPQPVCFLKEHVDIVRCVVALESRAYTGGYDGSLVIYDCHINEVEDISATKISKNTRAHDAGIACLVVEKESSDRESSDILLFTGGFDKKVKVWTGEGKLIHKLEGFIYGITGICYVPKNKTICFNSGSAFIYDPKSGDDVTNFIDTFVEEAQSNLQLLKYIPEFHVMLETTSRRQLLVYRYNPSGCLTSLKCHRTLDSVCFTKKSPILIFTGDSNGNVLKWEQKQSNQLIYNSETMLKSEFVTRECSRMQGQSKQQQQKAHEQQSDPKTNDESNQNQGKGIKRSNIVSKVLYVESLDYLLAACEDGNIYVWGIDQEGVAILDKMKHEEEKANIEADNYMQDYMRLRENDRDSFDYVEIGELAGDTSAITPNQQSKKTNSVHKDESELVTNRVAGFVLKKVFSEHSSSVTSLVAIERSHPNHTGIYLLSAGWDRRVVIWDLVNLRIFDLFRNKHVRNFDEVELASEGSILDMCYCEKYDWFAYASTDSHCYVRRFSTCGSEMVLVNSLQGHRSDVNCVRWLDGRDIWVTGGEDNSIRIWSKDGEQLEAINCMGAVNSLCFDISQDVVIAACHDIIKVFELESYHLVQTCMGHHDSIRDVCFIPERNHIVSVSWDRSIRVWRSYRKSSHKRKKIETDSEKKFETWFWEQMKLALKNGSSYDVSSYSDNLDSKD